jgi:three-Cys-motif partner protein
MRENETCTEPVPSPAITPGVTAPGCEHSYGGPWTEIKLDAVMYFNECYTKALTSVGFDLWYIDAFAGSGERQVTLESGGTFFGQPLQAVTETRAGSAKRALAIDPPFHHLIFNDTHADRIRELQRLKLLYQNRDIQITDGDANETLKEIFGAQRWTAKNRQSARALVFLDPYALQVEWSTLELLAKTQAVDVWYLFPLRDVTRQLAHRRSGVGPKETKLDLVLSPRWRELYSMPTPPTWHQPNLFGDVADADEQRNSNQRQIESWFQRQLQTIFAYASEPLPLLFGEARQLFSLFLCVANPSPKAIDLAKHFHKHVMKNFGPGASRQMSGLGSSAR